MHCEIYHLTFDGDEGREMRNKIHCDEYAPSPEEFDDLWEKVGEDVIPTDSESEVLNGIWGWWNAGSGRESVAFARRECKDCDESFDGADEMGNVDLAARQDAAERHERETKARGDPHEVEPGTRSMAAGDIIVVEGNAYLCQPIGWEEIDVGGDD